MCNHDPRQCPECGYSDADARFHIDHRLCRGYPFFILPGEYEHRATIQEAGAGEGGSREEEHL